MLFKSILLSLGLILSQVSFAASIEVKGIPNKCWNTKLNDAQEGICDVCEKKAEKVFKKECKGLIKASKVATELIGMLSGYVYEKVYPVAYENFKNVTTLRDNCQTEIINRCFVQMESKKKKD